MLIYPMAAKKIFACSTFVIKFGTDPLIVIAFPSFFQGTTDGNQSFRFLVILKRCVLALPWKVDLHQKNIIGGSDNEAEESTIREAVMGRLKDVFVKNHLLDWKKVTNLPHNHKVEEALAAIDNGGCGKDADVTTRLIGGIGFEQTQEVYQVDDDKDYNCLEQRCVMKMMASMGYSRGKGLGRCNQGPPSFVVETQMKRCTFGLGYRPTSLDEIRQKEIIREKARHKAKDIPFEVPMKPYPHTLNGQFVRAGETAPYWGFKDSEVVPSGWGDEF